MMAGAFGGFGKSSGPAAPPTTQPPPFGNLRPPSPPDSELQFSSPPAPRVFEAPVQTQSSSLAFHGAQSRPGVPHMAPIISNGRSELPFGNHGQLAPPGSQSPLFSSVGNQFSMNAHRPVVDAQRPNLLMDAWGSQSKSIINNHSNRRSRSPVEAAGSPASKQLRSQYLSSTGDVPKSYVNQHVWERRSVSPPKLAAKKNVPGSPDFMYPRSPLGAHGVNLDNAIDRPADDGLTKRISPAHHVFQENFPTLDGTERERELQAKAKRAARFKTELSDPVERGPNLSKQTLTSARSNVAEKQKHDKDSAGSSRNLADDMDDEGGESPSVIVGSCPDMCPESEREERERKGDLDQYERLDGDRNQTSKAIAVKKYNRTAEREAELIRPLPVLLKTMGHLLNLLDQQYDDSFLGLYNFLWDRMRAVRMDLRMQHIFNLEAITMLEQMIRLHIIAMHELCEYTKGEGFSEGFDAHLNIEQMNKTSVELFQLYDDHRKRGVFVPSEKEFRGYYALLKLDKHPGYKVEPAELSLDLAKMTPELRQTKEVLFAREVARSCRTGNFIAFFRLARKATYLQACLMHAHFSKLRTQALASLHAGLQNNQGLPVSHIAKWLAVEGEDLENLLEYHGFSIKEFEEPYMVKEGSFLNSDQDYPTQRSELVHSKKSDVIVNDVLFSGQASMPPAATAKKPVQPHANKNKRVAVPSRATESSLIVRDEEMTDSQVSSPRDRMLALRTDVYHGRIESPRASATSPRGISPMQHPFTISSNQQQSWVDSPQTFASSVGGIRQRPLASTISNKHQHGRLDTPRALSSSSNGVGLLKPIFAISANPYPDEARSLPTASTPLVNFIAPGFVPESQKSFSEWKGTHTPDLRVQTPHENVPHNRIKAETSYSKPSVEQERWAAPIFNPAKNSLQNDLIVQDFDNGEPADLPDNEDEVVPISCDKEVAEAKLKLFIRLWRRRYLRRKELREQNQIAAASALDSLSLGPPIRQENITIPISYGKLNIDQVMETRFDMQERSWSRLNVADVVTGKLTEINANAKCICWKVVLSSASQRRGNMADDRNRVASLSASEWLHHKLLLPTVEDDSSLLVSSPGLSISRKWIVNPSGITTCCLSVVKDANFGDSSESLLGASALLYALDNNVPLESQKFQLRNLVASLPPDSRVPLLILSGLFDRDSSDPSSNLFAELGLNNIDGSRIGNFIIVCLQVDGYFSDERLREGLEWLAINSPSEPVLHRVKTPELVHCYLNSSLDALERLGSQSVDPEKCISIFNEAVDRSMGDVTTAASGITCGWPCPELSLLDKSSVEHRAVELFFPTIGWSSAEKVGALISTLSQCKLPSFADDISWLARGCNAGEDIEDQRLRLQECLLRYLAMSSKSMNTTLAAKEANIMVQNCTRLELHGTRYYLVPLWVRIFRRVFNWQLNVLPSGASAVAYVLEKPHPAPGPIILHHPEDQNNHPSLSSHNEEPSLDEMIEVSRSPYSSGRVRPESKASQHMPTLMPNGLSLTSEGAESRLPIGYDPEAASAGTGYLVDNERHCSGDELAMVVEGHFVSGLEKYSEGIIPTLKASREADRLSKLLEQCSMLQDKIGEKLQVYF